MKDDWLVLLKLKTVESFILRRTFYVFVLKQNRAMELNLKYIINTHSITFYHYLNTTHNL